MHAYLNHCVLSETGNYNGALEIAKYSNFSSAIIKEEKKKPTWLPPHPFKNHCSMSQWYSIIPYKEYLLSFLHYYYIIHYLYCYRMSSNTGPQLRLTAPLLLATVKTYGTKASPSSFVLAQIRTSERKGSLIFLFQGWENESKQKRMG